MTDQTTPLTPEQQAGALAYRSPHGYPELLALSYGAREVAMQAMNRGGMTQREIGDAFGISESRVQYVLARARRRALSD